MDLISDGVRLAENSRTELIQEIERSPREVPDVQVHGTLGDVASNEHSKEMCHLANLRIQALRNEEYYSSGLSSSAYTTEDDEGTGDNRDDHLGEFVRPSEELIQKIVKQVESMFADSFVYRDSFMMKHIRRGMGGFVSMRLITSIRKVKSLTQDYRVVAFALKHSKELEVNEDNSKVRRIRPLPENFDSSFAQAILLTGMPKDPTIHDKIEEAVRLLLTVLKKINPEETSSALSNAPSIRIIKEVTHIPTSYNAEQSSLFSFEKGFCILLDFFGFEKLDVASLKEVLKPSGSEEEEEWKSAVDVHELPSIKADPSRRKTRRSKGTPPPDSSRDAEKTSHDKSFPAKTNPSGSPGKHTHSPSGWNSHEGSIGSTNRLNVSSPWGSPGSSPRVSPNVRRRPKPGPSPLAAEMGISFSSGGESPAGSPWLMRRRIKLPLSGSPVANQSVSKLAGNHDAEVKNSPFVQVTRLPRVPDDGKGFKLIRNLN